MSATPLRLRRIVSADDAQQAARRVLPRAVFDFYAGGAEDETSLTHNREAYQRVRLKPCVLSGVDAPTLQTQILGAAARLPLIVAPMGAVGFGRRAGDLELARAAARAGVPYTLSTVATTAIESFAGSGLGRKWFQLYPLRDRVRMRSLVERAKGAGFEALVLTADVPEGGKRERDLRNDFTMPFRFTPRNVADFASRPRWAWDMVRHGAPQLANLVGPANATDGGSTSRSSVGAGFDAAFQWSDVAELRRQWQGPLVIKGILRADDARRALECGVQALVISNHGGRQLDGTVTPLEVLPYIRQAVGSSMELYVDGGVRRGADIFKAVALGADAVMVGRPLLFGVCLSGEVGALHVLDLLADELRRTMVLCGTQGMADIGADRVGYSSTASTGVAVVRPLSTGAAGVADSWGSPSMLAPSDILSGTPVHRVNPLL